MATKIQIRRDSADNWSTLNPVLLPGEIGLEIDTLKFKIGPATPGGTNWNSILDYANVVPDDLNSTLQDYVLLSEIGSSGGVVGLNNDANAIIPGDSIIIEGSDNNSYETKLVIQEPTADRVITIPDEDGTLATQSYVDNAAANAVSSVIDTAPDALNTLNELAAALGDDANFATTVTNSLAEKQDKVSGVSDTEIGYLNGVTSEIQNQIDSKLNLSGGTLTGDLTLSGDPSLPLHAATKQYVDNLAAGLNFHASVHAATIENLSATYNNGSSGFGATLTSTANIALSVDNHLVNIGERVLVKNQNSSFQNGIYVLTSQGSSSDHWVLTRATDADNTPSGEVGYGDFVFVQNGYVNSGYGFILNTSGTINLGSTGLSYVEFNAGKTVIAANGLQELNPGEFSIDTSVTADIASAQTFTNKTIDSSNNTISITTSDITDFNQSTQDLIGGSLGAGLLYDNQTNEFTVDTTYIQTRVQDVSNTEIGYLNGVTSGIQGQIDLKSDLESPNFTGNMTADNLTLSGNLIVNGTNTILNTDTLQVEDNEIVLNSSVSGSPSLNAFIKVKRGVANDVSISWNEVSDKWQIDSVGGSPEPIATTVYVDSELSTHSSSTTGIHGIADTNDLALKTEVQSAQSALELLLTQHSVDTTNIHGIADTAQLATKNYADTSVSAHNNLTSGIHGIADTSQLATLTDINNAKSYSDSSLSTHSSDTTNVHGIADTSLLATGADITTAINDHNNETTNIHGIADTSQLATLTDISNTESYADNAVSIHNSDTTSVHGIADTSQLATNTSVSNAIDSYNLLTTNVHGIADTSALALTSNVNNALGLKQDKVLGVSDTEIGYLDGVTSSIQEQLNNKQEIVSGVSSTEIGYLDGVTSSIQTQLDNKQEIVSGVSSTEIGYLDGVTSGIQSQLNTKAPLTNPTFAGTVYLPSDTTIGDVSSTEISYVNGVTSGIQSQIDSKASLSGATFTGSISGTSMTLTGDLIVQGTTTTTNTSNIEVSDALIYIADGNPGNSMDIGFVGNYNDGSYKHTGFVRDASDNKWKLFTGITDEPDTTVNFGQGSLDALAVGAFEASSAIIGNVSNTEIQYLDGVTSAIQTQLDSKISTSTAAATYETISNVQLKAPINNPTFTGLVTLSSSGIAFSDGTQTKQGVPSQTYIYGAVNSNAFTSSTTLNNLNYRDAMIEVESTSGVTITIPSDSTTNFPVGTSIDILQTNTGQVTIAGDGFTPNATPGLKLRTRWSSCTLQKRGPNSWVVFGDLTA